jgi:hypothetical protein
MMTGSSQKSLYDDDFLAVIQGAFSRLDSNIAQPGEYYRSQLSSWVAGVYQTDRPEGAFLSPRSYPMLLMPYYAESSLTVPHDLSFQTDLVYSTVNGYYYIRLIDNLMDRHGKGDFSTLPILNFFHTEFQSPYQAYFSKDHHFWNEFRKFWYHAAEVTMLDARLSEIDHETFIRVCAQKTSAAKIPLAAVFYYHDSLTNLEAWLQFVDLLGCWHQAWNDFFDWVKDTRSGTRTYFLSEANRRKKKHEPVIDWVIREGFDWGAEQLGLWMEEMQLQAQSLECPELDGYLKERQRLFEIQKSEARSNLSQVGSLLDGFKRALDLPEG